LVVGLELAGAGPFEVRLPTAGIRVVGEQGRMATFQFRCPTTNLDVCAYIDEVNGPELVELQCCLACGKSHIVHLKTGRVAKAVE